LGDTKRHTNDIKDGIVLLKEQINLYRTYFPNDKSGLAFALHNLGVAFILSGNIKEGTKIIQECTEIYSSNYNSVHGYCIENMRLLAEGYMRMGEFSKARKTFNTALSMYKKNQKLDKSNLLFVKLQVSIGMLELKMGNYREAEKILKESIFILEKFYSESKRSIVYAKRHLVRTYIFLGLYHEAHKAIKKTLKYTEKTYGKEHMYIPMLYLHLGNIFLGQGMHKKAEKLIQNSYGCRKKTSKKRISV